MTYYEGKIIVVTGAAHGLGQSFAKFLSRDGALLILLDKDEKGLLSLKEEIGPPDSKHTFICADISNANEVSAVAAKILQEYGHIDVLINNAAVSHTGRIDQMKIEDFDWVIKTNLLGSFYCTKLFLHLLHKSPRSHIVNICSGIAFMGLPKFSAYATSKAALRAFSQSLHFELSNSNISVSIVYPGPLKTQIPTRSRHTHEQFLTDQLQYLSSNGYDTSQMAIRVLSQVKKGKRRIFLGWEVRLGYYLSSFCPGLLSIFIRRFPGMLPV